MVVRRVLDGLVIVAVGVVLLANTTGFLPWGVWWSIASLWPLLLVAAGIDIIGKGMDNEWLRILSSFVVIGGLAYGALVMTPSGFRMWGVGDAAPRAREVRDFESTTPRDAAIERGSMSVKGGLGKMTVTSGSDLVSVTGRSPFGQPTVTVDKSGNEVEIDLRTPEGRGPLFDWSPADIRLDVALDTNVVWDVEVETGVSEAEVDLSALRVSRVELTAGVSDTKLRLGPFALEDRSVPVRIKTGVSSVVLQVPRGAPVQLTHRGGLSDVNVPAEFDRASSDDGRSVWRTAGFDEGEIGYVIEIDAGVSGVKVETY